MLSPSSADCSEKIIHEITGKEVLFTEVLPFCCELPCGRGAPEGLLPSGFSQRETSARIPSPGMSASLVLSKASL